MSACRWVPRESRHPILADDTLMRHDDRPPDVFSFIRRFIRYKYQRRMYKYRDDAPADPHRKLIHFLWHSLQAEYTHRCHFIRVCKFSCPADDGFRGKI